jgi:hypothetical protein
MRSGHYFCLNVNNEQGLMEPKYYNNSLDYCYDPRSWLLRCFHELTIITKEEWSTVNILYIDSYSECLKHKKWIENHIKIIENQINILHPDYIMRYMTTNTWSIFWLSNIVFNNIHEQSQYILWKWSFLNLHLWTIRYNMYINKKIKEYNITMTQLLPLRTSIYLEAEPANDVTHLSIIHNKIKLALQIWTDIYLHCGIALQCNIVKWSSVTVTSWWPLHYKTLRYSNSYLNVYSKTQWLLQTCLWKPDNTTVNITPYAHIISKGFPQPSQRRETSIITLEKMRNTTVSLAVFEWMQLSFFGLYPHCIHAISNRRREEWYQLFYTDPIAHTLFLTNIIKCNEDVLLVVIREYFIHLVYQDNGLLRNTKCIFGISNWNQYVKITMRSSDWIRHVINDKGWNVLLSNYNITSQECNLYNSLGLLNDNVPIAIDTIWSDGEKYQFQFLLEQQHLIQAIFFPKHDPSFNKVILEWNNKIIIQENRVDFNINRNHYLLLQEWVSGQSDKSNNGCIEAMSFLPLLGMSYSTYEILLQLKIDYENNKIKPNKLKAKLEDISTNIYGISLLKAFMFLWNRHIALVQYPLYHLIYENQIKALQFRANTRTLFQELTLLKFCPVCDSIYSPYHEDVYSNPDLLIILKKKLHILCTRYADTNIPLSKLKDLCDWMATYNNNDTKTYTDIHFEHGTNNNYCNQEKTNTKKHFYFKSSLLKQVCLLNTILQFRSSLWTICPQIYCGHISIIRLDNAYYNEYGICCTVCTEINVFIKKYKLYCKDEYETI